MNCNTLSLDNKELIDITEKTRPETVEPLYWYLEDALYRGDTDIAESFHQMFLYMAKYREDLLNALQPAYRERLKEITYELYSPEVSKKNRSITIKMASMPIKLPFKKEKNLKEYLQEHPQILSEAIGEEIKITGTEVDTDFEYT